MFFRSKKSKDRGIISRLFRSLFAIVILSGMAFGIALSVNKISTLDAQTFVSLTSPVLSRLGLSEEKTGEVAGEFIERVSETGVRTSFDSENLGGGSTAIDVLDTESTVAAKVALITDSGGEVDTLTQALTLAKNNDVDYVFHLGDLTQWGDVDSLAETKNILDESSLKYFAIPGDHDLAQSETLYGTGGLENFKKVFGANYHRIKVGGVVFVMLDTSANRTPLDESRMLWARQNIPEADFVLVSQPLYHPQPTELMSIMGLVKGEVLPDIKAQADTLLSLIRNSNVQAVFAGDHHMSSISTDAINADLTHYVVGACAKERNVQTFPRFDILTVYEDLTFDVDEIVLR